MGKITTQKRKKINRVPILVIEDNADQWLIIRSALSQGFPEVEPIWINNIPQALKYLDTCSTDESKFPRMILLDLYLPNRDQGWTFLESVKSHPINRQIPVVVLSSSQEADDILKAYTYSIASYVVKPDTYHQWLTCVYTFRRYWWETVALPMRAFLPV